MHNEDNIPVLDLLEEGLTKQDLQQRIADYVDEKSLSIAKEAEARVLKQAREDADTNVLMARGNRMLTSDETKFYESVIGRVKGDASQAVKDVPMPNTVIERVFEDLQRDHPLLNAVDFVSAPALVKFVYNKDGIKLAVWGKITDAITKELSSGFGELDASANKLSAYLPISQGIVDLGPVWLDQYVRIVLAESIAEGIEDGIINGNGLDQPVGMIRDLSKPIDQHSGYTPKVAKKITDLSPATYATLLAEMSKTPVNPEDGNGDPRSRVVGEVLMIVNPTTYLSKVFPATTYQNVNGTYVEVFPYPTKVIQSPAVPEGKAIFGIQNKYFFALCADRAGKIEVSDEAKFLEDQRLYKTKFYGDGIPKDNNAFIYTDITGLKQVLPQVETVTQTAAAAKA